MPLPALIAEDTCSRSQNGLVDNKRYAARSSRKPFLLQDICSRSRGGYAYYRTSTRTSVVWDHSIALVRRAQRPGSERRVVADRFGPKQPNHVIRQRISAIISGCADQTCRRA